MYHNVVCIIYIHLHYVKKKDFSELRTSAFFLFLSCTCHAVIACRLQPLMLDPSIPECGSLWLRQDIGRELQKHQNRCFADSARRLMAFFHLLPRSAPVEFDAQISIQTGSTVCLGLTTDNESVTGGCHSKNIQKTWLTLHQFLIPRGLLDAMYRSETAVSQTIYAWESSIHSITIHSSNSNTITNSNSIQQHCRSKNKITPVTKGTGCATQALLAWSAEGPDEQSSQASLHGSSRPGIGRGRLLLSLSPG